VPAFLYYFVTVKIKTNVDFPLSCTHQHSLAGLYTNGIFKFVLRLPPAYNGVDAHPEIVFTSYVFNPHVHPDTGVLDVKSAYPRWDRK
jgi:ubiquitin-protein ligase